MFPFDDVARIDRGIDSRSISFENPHGERGRGGVAANGRKGAPSRKLAPGETVVLADIAGPGCLRHIWMAFVHRTPEQTRGMWMEVFYDDSPEPSVSVPCLDFFGLPHGRMSAYFSALTAVHEGRGLNAYFPMPFSKRIRVELTNSSTEPNILYFQIDYTLERLPAEVGYLHATFRRENPTLLKQDFVIARGLQGPGRFLGCVVGIRVLRDDMCWYGEGEFKLYRDGDRDLPTICGTGLEDYVGSAWGMGRHAALYGGAPLQVSPPDRKEAFGEAMPDFLSFYRWHIPDPIVFQESLTATIQQIGALQTPKDQPELFDKYQAAGAGWNFTDSPTKAFGLAERSDDYCATAFLYCQKPQAVPRLDPKSAMVDIGLRPYEQPAH